MRTGNRLFPYPVLNANTYYSGYREDISFSFLFDTNDDDSVIIEDETYLVLANSRYSVDSMVLQELLDVGKASCVLVVECSASLYRHTFALDNFGNDIRIPLKDLSGKVELSSYIYACDTIDYSYSNEVLPVYEGFSFLIEPYDILAVFDGLSFSVDHDPVKDTQASSIFTVVSIEDDTVNQMVYSDNGSRISIQLPKRYYGCYENIKMHSRYNNIAFSMMAIPVLALCIQEIKSEHHDEIEEITETRSWFNAVRISYQRETGQALSADEFDSTDSFELAQLVLNNASCNGLNDFAGILINDDEAEEGEND